jgi:hypothetical protein
VRTVDLKGEHGVARGGVQLRPSAGANHDRPVDDSEVDREDVGRGGMYPVTGPGLSRRGRRERRQPLRRPGI